MRDKRDEQTRVRCETRETSRMMRERINDKFGGKVTSGMNETGEAKCETRKISRQGLGARQEK